jgi:hypothetical protein
MGCCQAGNRKAPSVKPKIEPPRQEKIIEKAEASIPFSQKSAKDLDMTFKSHGVSGRLSVAQLKKSLGVLDLDPQVFTDPDTQVYKFLDKLKNETKLYDISKLSLCSILLGTDDSKTKARILFNHFDSDANEKFDKSELKKMIEEMVHISLKLIPLIALRLDEEDKNEDTLPKEELDDYIESIEKESSKFVDIVVEKLIGSADALSSDEFVAKVSSSDSLERILRSSSIRVTLYEMTKGLTF